MRCYITRAVDNA